MMKLNYKYKFILLIILIVLSCIVVYLLSVRKTIAAVQENKELTRKIELATAAPEKIMLLQKQLEEMEQLLVYDNPVDFEQILLEQVTDFCYKNDVILIEFPKTDVSGYQNYQIFTNRIVLEGGFKKIVEFIYEAEQKNKTGKIVSVQFKRIKDIRSKQTHLYAYIYFQNIQITPN